MSLIFKIQICCLQLKYDAKTTNWVFERYKSYLSNIFKGTTKYRNTFKSTHLHLSISGVPFLNTENTIHIDKIHFYRCSFCLECWSWLNSRLCFQRLKMPAITRLKGNAQTQTTQEPKLLLKAHEQSKLILMETNFFFFKPQDFKKSVHARNNLFPHHHPEGGKKNYNRLNVWFKKYFSKRRTHKRWNWIWTWRGKFFLRTIFSETLFPFPLTRALSNAFWREQGTWTGMP